MDMFSRLPKDMEDMKTMVDFFTDEWKFAQMPLTLQLKYLVALSDFVDHLRPLYVEAIMLRGVQDAGE